MPAVFSYDAQTGPIYIDINGIAAGYGVLSTPVTGFVPGDVVQTVALTIQGTGLATIAAAVDMVQRTGGFYEWTDSSSIDAHFTLTPAQIAAIAAATNCTYSVVIMILRNGAQQIRQVQRGAISTLPSVPLSPLVVNSITLTGGPVSGGIGAQAQLTATCFDGFGNLLPSAAVTWSSSNNNIASVDATGRVTFMLPGAVTISASSQGVAASTTGTCFDNSYLAPTDKQVSAYSAAQSKWLPSILTAAFLSIAAGSLVVGGGWPGGATELAPGAAAGYVRSNGSAWVRQTGVPAADVTPGSFEAGLYTFPSGLSVAGGLTVTTGAITGPLANTLTFGAHHTGTSYNNSAAVTIGVDATPVNTVSTIVSRDGSGNFAAGTITATLAGNASTATLAANASTATRLAAAVNINGVAFDGSANITVTADASTLTGAALNAGVAVGLAQITGLLSGGKIAPGLMPPLAISETFVVANQAAMLALAAGQGDIALRTDISTTFILSGTDPTILSNWTQLLVPPNAVLSVAGKTGVVTLVSADIGDAVATNTANRLVLRDSVGSFSANIITATLAGNAATATQLQTSRTINGVAFDGTASITIAVAASALTGSTLAAGVTSSSLTGVGTIATGVWQGTPIADTFLATIATGGKVANSATTATPANTASGIVLRDVSGNFAAGAITAALVGNASTATAIQTARTIWGQSFNGTADITGTIAAPAATISGPINGTAQIRTTGTLTTNVASSVALDYAGGFGRIVAQGPDALTLGQFLITLTKSDGSSALGVISATSAAVTISATTTVVQALTVNGSVSMVGVAGQAAILGGTTGFKITNNAVSADNFSMTDAGAVTIRAGLTVSAGTTAVQALTATTGVLSGGFTAGGSAGAYNVKFVGSGTADRMRVFNGTAGNGVVIDAANAGETLQAPLSLSGTTLTLTGTPVSILGNTTMSGTLGIAGALGVAASVTATGTTGTIMAVNHTDVAASFQGFFNAQRSGAAKWWLGSDASDSFALLNAAGNAANLLVTDPGNVTVRGTLKATLGLDFGSASYPLTNVSTQATVGANGAATPPTANPVGYIKVTLNGAVSAIIPYYNA